MSNMVMLRVTADQARMLLEEIDGITDLIRDNLDYCGYESEDVPDMEQKYEDLCAVMTEIRRGQEEATDSAELSDDMKAIKAKALVDHDYCRMSEFAWESINSYIEEIAEELADENGLDREDDKVYEDLYTVATELLVEDMIGRNIW